LVVRAIAKPITQQYIVILAVFRERTFAAKYILLAKRARPKSVAAIKNK